MIRPLLALFLFASVLSAQANAYLDAINAGREALFANKLEDALDAFLRARKIAPQDWRGHAYQSLTHIQQALSERAAPRRKGLLDKAETIAGELIKRAGLRFSDPLYKYLLGVVESIRGNIVPAYTLLKTAATRYPHARYKPYEEIALRSIAERAYAKVAIELGMRHLAAGRFDEADNTLNAAAKYLPKEDPQWLSLHRNLAVVSEQLSRKDRAVYHLEECIKRLKDKPDDRYELLATVAMIHFGQNQIKKGEAALKLLADAPDRLPVMSARCMLRFQRALLDPEGPPMDAALKYYRESLKKLEAKGTYGSLISQFARMVAEKVSEKTAAEHRALIDEAIGYLNREIKLRPECPAFYFHLKILYRRIGDDENELKYDKLHKRKKQEFENKARFDAMGRPSCT